MAYINDPCDRCGSKRIISKSHTEVIETFSGPQKIVVSVIKCTNKTCQKAQEDMNAADKRQSDERREKKEKQESVRRNNIQLSRKKAVVN